MQDAKKLLALQMECFTYPWDLFHKPMWVRESVENVGKEDDPSIKMMNK